MDPTLRTIAQYKRKDGTALLTAKPYGNKKGEKKKGAHTHARTNTHTHTHHASHHFRGKHTCAHTHSVFSKARRYTSEDLLVGLMAVTEASLHLNHRPLDLTFAV